MLREPGIIERALPLKSVDHGVDHVRSERPIFEFQPQFPFGVPSTRQKLSRFVDRLLEPIFALRLFCDFTRIH